jgi:hypothetical protein
MQVSRIQGDSKVGALPVRDDGEGKLDAWYQYRDPLVGVLDYIIEVRPPGSDRSFNCTYRAKEMSGGCLSGRGHHGHCP